MKLGLGTAQFGLEYGVTNGRGRVSAAEAERVVQRAAEVGVRVLDTAPAYGEAETVLGTLLGPTHGFRIVTKTPQFSAAAGEREVEALLLSFDLSLRRLKQDSVDGLLFHRVADLFGPGGEQLWQAAEHLRAHGRVRKIGASVYDGQEIDRLLAIGKVDLVQLPLNWLDQRLVASGHLAKLQAAGVEIHARSPFLQGVLLVAPESLPEFFAPLRAHLRTCVAQFKSAGMSPAQAAVRFAAARPEVSTVICGVTSIEELDEIADAYGSAGADFDWSSCALGDPRWLDPSRWRAVSSTSRAAQ